ncbi:hypothetical protein DFJ74DRAFT_769234 [Hyaloraphidium curvatum]|nr:hypothetical protein DFJ74DRAFT_769234 [Hyaloraphidium curvatum]
MTDSANADGLRRRANGTAAGVDLADAATSLKPRRQQASIGPVFVLKALAWTLGFGIIAVILQGSQWPALLLPKDLRYAYIRETERLFGVVLLLLTWLFFPTTFVLTGDVSKFLASKSDKAVVISNHQNFLDWWYLWHLAWMQKRHGDVKIVLRGDLRKVPVFGMGCDFFKFTWVKFGNFKGPAGESPMAAFTKSILRYVPNPFWFLIFPEGTLIYPKNLARSKEFADSNGLPFDQTHTLLPKHGGLYSAMVNLKPDTVWDLTIGYSDVLPTEMPFDVFPVPLCFFRPALPGGARFGIHIRDVPVASIPGFGGKAGSAPLKPAGATGPYSVPADAIKAKSAEDQFAQWLRELWLEKDRRMQHFYHDRWNFSGDVDSEVAVELYGGKATAAKAEKKEVRMEPGIVDLVELFAWCGVFAWAGWFAIGAIWWGIGVMVGGMVVGGKV